MQNILFWLTEKYYLIECRVGNFINLRKGNRIKTLPQKRMKKIALRHRLFAIIRFWETHKLRQNL